MSGMLHGSPASADRSLASMSQLVFLSHRQGQCTVMSSSPDGKLHTSSTNVPVRNACRYPALYLLCAIIDGL
jgi:hypothetical protein